MNRYIDADKLARELAIELEKTKVPRKNEKSNIPYLLNLSKIYYALFVLSVTEAEDVAPVVHAEWKVNEHIELDFCSNCLEPVRRYVTAGQMDRSNYKGETFWNYCPHCGAKMDEVE